jgi:hypothetical protein
MEMSSLNMKPAEFLSPDIFCEHKFLLKLKSCSYLVVSYFSYHCLDRSALYKRYLKALSSLYTFSV